MPCSYQGSSDTSSSLQAQFPAQGSERSHSCWLGGNNLLASDVASALWVRGETQLFLGLEASCCRLAKTLLRRMALNSDLVEDLGTIRSLSLLHKTQQRWFLLAFPSFLGFSPMPFREIVTNISLRSLLLCLRCMSRTGTPSRSLPSAISHWCAVCNSSCCPF